MKQVAAAPDHTDEIIPDRAIDRTILWTNHNRGALTTIANEAKCSAQFVHLVLRGQRKSSDGRVERLLREAGAPIKATS